MRSSPRYRSRLIDAMLGRDLAADLTEKVKACFAQHDIDAWKKSPEQFAGDRAGALTALETAFRLALESRLRDFSKDLLADFQPVVAD